MLATPASSGLYGLLVGNIVLLLAAGIARRIGNEKKGLNMKVWELMSKTRLFKNFKHYDREIVCLCCGEKDSYKIFYQSPKTWYEEFKHKSSCFLIQDYDTAWAGSLKENWTLFILAMRSLWQVIVTEVKRVIKDVNDE